MASEAAVQPRPAVNRLLSIQTPLGRPVRWAEVAMVSDIGDSHELNDDRCLVLTSSSLDKRAGAPADFMLCLLADGATGSSFGARSAIQHAHLWQRQAGWRASQLAQSAFVDSFLGSAEVDVLIRLKDGLRAADRTLTDSTEGTLSTTLVALYLSADGTAYAASIGDSTLLVLPPARRTPADRRLKKLGYEDSTAVGSGDTTLSTIHESECIEQWWPHKEGGGSTTRVTPGTYLVLMSDGIADNLPVEFIEQLVRRHPLDRATVALPVHTRERRIETQKRSGGSTQQLGLDNMSAIVVRFDGQRGSGFAAPLGRSDDLVRLVTVVGTHGGPTPEAGGQFGMACVAGPDAGTQVAASVRWSIEAETDELRLSSATSGSRFAMLGVDARGNRSTHSCGRTSIGPGSDVPVSIAERTVFAAHDSQVQRLIRRPAIWGPAIAALAIFALVSSAFATGAVRPAPPPGPTPRPGEPRPTADTRPSLSIGGFVLQPPMRPTPVPGDTPEVANTPADSAQPAAPAEAPAGPALDAGPPGPVPDDAPARAAPPCGNWLGTGCQPLAPPARPARTAPSPPNQVVPVPSPAVPADGSLSDFEVATSAPPRGSRLESALQGVSAADANFARQVDPPAP